MLEFRKYLNQKKIILKSEDNISENCTFNEQICHGLEGGVKVVGINRILRKKEVLFCVKDDPSLLFFQNTSVKV